MTTLRITARDMFVPRFGMKPQEWVGLCLYKMHTQERNHPQVMEWPSGYVGFEHITPRLLFARAIRETLLREEWAT